MNTEDIPTIETLISTVQRHGYANERTEADAIGREAMTAIAELRAEGGEAVDAADLYEARLQNILAIVAVIDGDHVASVEMADRALTLAERANAREQQAMALGTFGIVYDDLANYPKALDYQERALKINESLNDMSGIIRCYGNLGSVYYKLDQYDRAMEYFQKTYEYAMGLQGETVGQQYDKQLAGALSNIGGVHFAKGDDEQALPYFERALKINEEGGDAYFTAINLSNIAGVYARRGHRERAVEFYEQAIAVSKPIGFTSNMAGSLTQLGDLLVDEAMLKRAIELADSIGDQLHLNMSHYAMSRLYSSRGDAELALHHYREGHRIEKEYLGQEAKRQAMLLEHRQQIEASERDRQVKLARFQEQEKILHNILPSQIADRILDGEMTIADHHDNVSVFFSDIVGFTTMSQKMSAATLVNLLNTLFSELDRLAVLHGLEKIKTIGDAYMAVAGVPVAVEDHADRTMRFAVDVLEAVRRLREHEHVNIDIRIGLHTGPVVAGVIGTSKFAYDLWGDTVNTASRMESHGEAGKIHASDDFVRTLTLSSTAFVDRGMIDVKGKGAMRTWIHS
ncbi:MAG: tetratricopeptide repeat protein [Candidatus Kapabacteria bacterium]|nr:tetratricopeptide repeat protein [Candidatus Kapabacteria bacterium]